VVVLVSGCARSEPKPVDPALTRLDTAVRTVSTARAAALSAVDAIERAATQLDRTDELSAAGRGQPARSSFRTSLPMLRSARQGLTRFGNLITTYSTALDQLRDASRSSLVRPAEQTALQEVVRDGRREAAALEGFRGSLSAVWPAYDLLAADEDVWTSHAASGWYRNAKEGAAAYAVLVRPRRAALQVARSRLAAAANALVTPTQRQSATLKAADKALDRLRAG
jgi:hypothetical protein